jgi:hypothetical protein
MLGVSPAFLFLGGNMSVEDIFTIIINHMRVGIELHR